MNSLQVLSLNILLIGFSHGLNPLLQPSTGDEDDGKWRDHVRVQIIDLFDQHHIDNQYQVNDIAFIQFGNDSTGFIDQLFINNYRQFNGRAIMFTQVPLLKEHENYKKTKLVVLFMCHYAKARLQKFLKKLQNSMYWSTVQPILIIPTFPITFANHANLRYMFGFFKYEYIFNVGIIYYSRRTNRIERIAYNPFAADPIVIQPHYLFASKVKNLNGYEIKITQYDDIPRSYIDQHGIVNGMDGLALYTVCRHLNASHRVMRAAGGPETSYSNVVYDLVRRRAELNFNHRLFWSPNYLNSIVIPIYPYEHENMVLLIPFAKVVPPYRHFIDAFQTELWLVIGLTFVLITATWVFVNPRLKRLRHRFEVIDIGLDLFRMHLALPLPRIISNTRERRLFWIVSMYTFIVFQTYQTKLTSYLMSRRYMRNYQTIAEVNQSNLELVLSKNYQALINQFLDTNFMTNTQIDVDLSIWQLRQTLVENESFYNSRRAFFVTKQESDSFRYSALNQIHDDQLLEPIAEKIMTSAASYMVLRNSPFENEISNVIRRLRESGLIEYFKVIGYFDVRRHFNMSAQYLMQLNTRPKRVQLSLRVFRPILQIFVTGIFVSIMCFLLECSSHRLSRVAKRIRRRLWARKIKVVLKRWFIRFIFYVLKD